MIGVLLPVLSVERGNAGIADDEKVLGVVILRGLGKIKAAGYDLAAVDDHHLVMGDGMHFVDQDGNAGISEEGSAAVAL